MSRGNDGARRIREVAAGMAGELAWMSAVPLAGLALCLFLGWVLP